MADRAHLSEKEAQDAYDSEFGNLSEFSGKISELCKYVWAGSLAIFYALITSDPTSTANNLLGSQRSLLFIAAIAGALAFLFDYLQNFCAYLHARLLVDWLESSKGAVDLDEYNRRTTSVFSMANVFFFYAKNIAVLVTAALVAYVIIAGFLK